ncbi:MAG: transposase [Candidatus Marinimicrobia bacterium]|nr:transposase [FCB group bacterium]MBL7024525.1 transposase [Candidatus Neomarinimicrobiota bacterium]
MHRNSRRRPYRPFGYYFITTNVCEGFAVLNRLDYGHLLEHVLYFSARIHSSTIIAYKINPDHVHLIVQIGKKGTISDFMGSWKRQFSRQVNQLLFQEALSNTVYPGNDVPPGDDSNRRLVTTNNFRWQKSYHSHLITSHRDFENHINYILKQQKHHGLEDNKYCFVDHGHVFKFK